MLTLTFNPFMPNGLFCLHSLDRFISSIKRVWLVFIILPCFIEYSVYNANSVDPDLGLRVYCLLMPILWYAMHE